MVWNKELRLDYFEHMPVFNNLITALGQPQNANFLNYVSTLLIDTCCCQHTDRPHLCTVQILHYAVVSTLTGRTYAVQILH